MNIMRTTLLASVALLGFAACSDDADSSTAGDDTTAVSTTANDPYEYVEDDDTVDTTAADDSGDDAGDDSAGDATVVLSDSSLGEILTSADGMTLYLFTTDSADASTCNAGCDTSWPPLTDAVVAGEGLDDGDFTTITRDDGTTQVVYLGHPLYFFVGDSEPGDVTGQGVGGNWFAVTASGDAAG